MNDGIGEIGLVPTRPVFEIVSRFSMIGTEIPTQKETMEVLVSAQEKFKAIICERK